MSTKTSIKRVALVAAAALTIGGFSAVSAHADATVPFYVSTADAGVEASSAAAATQSASQVAGALNYVTLTAASNLASGSTLGVTVSAGAGTVSVATQPTTSGSVETLTATGSNVTSVGYQIIGGVIKIGTPTAGAFTVAVNKVVSANGQATTTLLQTFNFTVTAASVVGQISTANSFAVRIDTTTDNLNTFATYETGTVGITSSTTDSSANIAKGAVGSAPAQASIVAVKLGDTQATSKPLAGVAVAASIAGAGLVAGTGALTDTLTSGAFQNYLPAASSTTDAAGWAFFSVAQSGTAGTGVLTITYTDALGNVTTVATKSFVFYSSTVASITVAAPHSVLPKAVIAGFTPTVTEGLVYTGLTAHGASSTSSTAPVTIVAADSKANPIPGADDGTTASTLFTVTSSSPSVATVGSVYWDNTNKFWYPVITPVAAGTTTITVTDVATGLITGSVAITVTGADVASVSASTDASSYDPGTKVKYLLTVKNAASAAVPDGTYAQFFTKGSAPISNVAIQGTVSSESITTVNGVSSQSFYAPLQGGNVLITGGVLGASTTIFATALQSATLADATFSVNGSSDASAATDAANAATDAANAAADAADNATQAASEALAAVNSLATTVASLIAGIKAQITSLTNLITKIKNKVGA